MLSRSSNLHVVLSLGLLLVGELCLAESARQYCQEQWRKFSQADSPWECRLKESGGLDDHKTLHFNECKFPGTTAIRVSRARVQLKRESLGLTVCEATADLTLSGIGKKYGTWKKIVRTFSNGGTSYSISRTDMAGSANQYYVLLESTDSQRVRCKYASDSSSLNCTADKKTFEVDDRQLAALFTGEVKLADLPGR